MNWSFLELAKIVGVTDRTVNAWRKEGMPVLRQKKKNALQVDSVAFFDWYTARSARTQKQDANGIDWTQEKRRLEVEEKRGALLDREEVGRVWADQLAKVRKMVLSIPNRCAPLVTKKTEKQSRLVLDAEVKRILKEVSEYGD